MIKTIIGVLAIALIATAGMVFAEGERVEATHVNTHTGKFIQSNGDIQATEYRYGNPRTDFPKSRTGHYCYGRGEREFLNQGEDGTTT